MTSFTLNGKKMEVTAEPDTPLLWVIRDEAGLTGTKFGCGIGMWRSVHHPCGRQGAALVRDAG
jgi:aerobic-type carbon monoxide dehydrogenase small subunit (CoxS/CutS family)